MHSIAMYILQNSRLIPGYPSILQFVNGCDRLSKVITIYTKSHPHMYVNM